MLATFYQTTNFAKVLTPQQIFIFGFVTMIYIPCVATIAALKREFGNLTAFLVSLGEFIGALLLGGLLNLLLRIF
jgi:ferrous iron transport protein B